MGLGELSRATVAVLILVGIIAITLLGLAGSIAEIMKGSADIQECQLSFLAASKIEQKGGLIKMLTDINLNCPRPEPIKIGRRFLTSQGEIEQTEINEALAQQLYSCYKKTGEGKLDPFGSDAEDVSICIVCSEIHVEKDLWNKKITGLYPYLYTHRIPGQEEYFTDRFNLDFDISTPPTFSWTPNTKENILYAVYRTKNTTSPGISSFFSMPVLTPSDDYTPSISLVPRELLFETIPVDDDPEAFCDHLLN